MHYYFHCYVLMKAWCRELHGKRGCHEILKKAWVELSLRTMGIESWCFLLVLCFWSFMNCWAWFAAFFMSSVWPYHFFCEVMLLLVFMIFLLLLFSFLPFMFWVWGISWERGKLMEIGRDVWNPTDDIRPRWSSVHE